jgi:hypothetical protein
MKCQLCGTEVPELGIHSHRGSGICRVRRRAYELERRGLVSADGHHDRPPKMLAAVCETAGVEYEVAPSHYRSGITFYSTFVPAWVAALYRLRSTDGAGWPAFGDALQALMDDPELRDAVLAAADVSTGMVINLLIQQGILKWTEPA